jgi:putative ABC transport system permease protein
LQDGNIPEGADPFYAFRCYVEDRESLEFYLIGMEADSAGIKMNDTRGNALPRDQVNITSPLASRLKLREGDTIHFVNKLDGKPYSLVIDGIIHAYGEQNVHVPLEKFNSMTAQEPGSYKGLLSSHELDFDESLLAGVFDYRASEELNERNMANTVLVTLIAAFAGIIAVVVIYLVTSLIIEESRPSISLFKIFGYRRKELSKLILNSSAPAVFTGFWLGLPLMLIFSSGLYNYVADIINMLTPIIINPLYILLSFVIIFAVYELTRRLFGGKIAKISMSEALKAGTE